MKRLHLAPLAALWLAACTFKPAGTCSTAADCFTGQSCTAGLCVGCQADAECQGWQTCNVAARRCVAASGKCANDQACQAWETCDETFTCTLRPGACLDAGGCQAWQVCVGHACTLPAGRCDTVADCGAAQICTAEHRCVSGCPTGSECQAWEACGADKQCALQPGRCLATIDCAAWQTCDVPSHTCALTPGKCDLGVGCAAWEDCAVHDCVLQAGRCNVAGDCAAWKTCDGTNTCALKPGSCDTGADCAAWETCGATTHACTLLPGRCNLDADCPGWQTCSATNTCSAVSFTTGGAYYFGEISSLGFAVNGLASPSSPTRPFITLPYWAKPIVIHPDGGILYLTALCPDRSKMCIRRASGEPLVRDQYGYWSAPLNPLDNDQVLVEVAGISSFVLQEGTGQILYGVPGGTDTRVHWYDLAGVERAAHGEVMAWNAAGALLFRRDDPPFLPGNVSYALQVISPEGVAADVTAFNTINSSLAAARARGTGFWVYNGVASPTVMERWSIAADGSGVKDGDYSNPGFTPYVWWSTVIDGEGTLWAESFSDVYRIPLAPEPATLVLPQGVPAGYNDNLSPNTAFRPWLDSGGQMATGP